MKSKEEIKAAAENFINTTGELYPVSLFIAGARWMEESTSQQASEGMYTREQVEAAFDAGQKIGLAGYSKLSLHTEYNKKQFIQSLK